MESRSGCWAWPWHPGLLPASRKRGAWGCRDALLGLGAAGTLAAWRGLRALPWSWPLMLFHRVHLVPLCVHGEVREAPVRRRGGGSPGPGRGWLLQHGCVQTGKHGLGRGEAGTGPSSGAGCGLGRHPRWVPVCLVRGSCGFLHSGLRASLTPAVCASVSVSVSDGRTGPQEPRGSGTGGRPGSGVCRHLSRPVLCRQPRCSPLGFLGKLWPSRHTCFRHFETNRAGLRCPPPPLLTGATGPRCRWNSSFHSQVH